ncbi:TIGR01777 family protein [Candidatus Poribacteria bacterium]|nr:TIGR01777 family protein [Candidatus Poribacteria bacterium]
MKILISGSSGLIGSALVEYLNANGHTVGRLLRNNLSKNSPSWDTEKGIISPGDFIDFDVFINLAGENISNGRWTQAKKTMILNSRVNGTKIISDFLAKSEHKPRVFISGSATGFYGDRGDELMDENKNQGTGFLSNVCKQWEDATASAVEAGIRVVNIRTGMVLSSSGGALEKMILPFKMGLGGTIGNGKQYMSWISIDDLVEIIQFIISKDLINGPVNLVSPCSITNYEFTKILGDVLNRPTIFPLPAFIAQTIFGEMADELLLSSNRVIPKKLIDAGYKFKHSDLKNTLQYLLKNIS